MLSYTSNLLPAETVADLVDRTLPFFGQVRRQLGWSALGLDLHLGHALLTSLRADAGALDRVTATSADHGLTVCSINAFPLQPFQGGRVKDGAYHPDWSSDARLEATCIAIDLALALTAQPEICISTVPGSYAPWGGSQAQRAAIAQRLGRAAAHAWRASQQHHRRVIVALEPEPQCTIERIDQALALWRDDLPTWAVPAAAIALDGDGAAAQAAIAEHLGLCLDACHLAVGFEDPAAAVAAVSAAGIPIAKIHISACPEVREPGRHRQAVAALAAWDEPRFLHQTAWQDSAGTVHQLPDLDALRADDPALDAASCLRSHFHVPVHRPLPLPAVGTTAAVALALLAALRAQGGDPAVAIETYTWSLFAADDQALAEGVAAELAWLAARDGDRA